MLIVCGEVNFTNLSRYSRLNEKTYRRQFSEAVDFGRLNAELIEAAGEPEHQQLLGKDSSFLSKSGKATVGLERFWTGCKGRVEQGLEGSLVGVVDVETAVSDALHAQQTFAQSEMKGGSRMGQYLGHLTLVRPQLPFTAVGDGCNPIELGGDEQIARGCKSVLSLHRFAEATGQTAQVRWQS